MRCRAASKTSTVRAGASMENPRHRGLGGPTCRVGAGGPGQLLRGGLPLGFGGGLGVGRGDQPVQAGLEPGQGEPAVGVAGDPGVHAGGVASIASEGHWRHFPS
jgi:hypothetical protein